MSVPLHQLSGKERFYIVINNKKATISLDELVAYIRNQIGG